jgi:hypothetical protein
MLSIVGVCRCGVELCSSVVRRGAWVHLLCCNRVLPTNIPVPPPPPIPSPQTDSRVKDGQLMGAENARMLMVAAAGVVAGLLLAKVSGLRG